ncbi:hypothetical protein, partial [Escherichia coli]
SLKTSIKTITYLSDTGCLEIQGASLDLLKAWCVCPRCGTSGQCEIEMFVPSGNLVHYNPGDKLINITRNKLKDNFISEGYCECLYCGKDFFVDIWIKDNVITSVTVNSKGGYIS